MACENIDVFRGAGEALIATLDPVTKLPNSNYRKVGNTPLFTVNSTQEFEEVKETKSGNRQTIAYSTTSIDTEVAMELNSFSKENLAMAFYGTESVTTGAAVVGEAHTVYALNEAIPLANVKVSAVVVDDNLGSPLTEGVDYTVDLLTGVITFISDANIALPESITVDYTFADQETIIGFSEGQKEYAVMFVGKNVHTGKAVKVLLPRVVMSVAETLELISDTTISLAVTGKALIDCNDEVMNITKEA